MFLNDLLTISLFILALYVTPGPATLSLAASGAAYGFKRSIPYFFGIYAGLLISLSLVIFGLAFIFEDFPIVFTVFKYISLIYILYLSYTICKTRPKTASVKTALTFTKGLVLNLINPKAYVVNLALISQFSEPGEDYFYSVFIILLLVALIVFLTNGLWVLAGEQIGRLFESKKSAKFIQLSFAFLLSSSVIYASFFMN